MLTNVGPFSSVKGNGGDITLQSDSVVRLPVKYPQCLLNVQFDSSRQILVIIVVILRVSVQHGALCNHSNSKDIYTSESQCFSRQQENNDGRWLSVIRDTSSLDKVPAKFYVGPVPSKMSNYFNIDNGIRELSGGR